MKAGFKDSPLGSIPVGWEVKRLDDILDIVSGQVDPKIEPYKSYVLIAPNHIESNTGKIKKFETASDQNAISGKYLFRENDVIYSKIRPYLAKVWLADRQGICSADMYPLRMHENCNSSFIFYILLSNRFTVYINALSLRTGIPKVNREEISSFKLPLPPLAEQEKIAEILTTVDDKIGILQDKRAAYQELKKGLMQQLLTGKMRVNHLLDEVS